MTIFSCTDVSAALNIGRILAHRCQQCGLINCFFDTTEYSLSNESVNLFLIYIFAIFGRILLRD